MKVLLTGVAGFIGFHVGMALAKRGDTVVGLDNLNDYYDVRLKKARRDTLVQEKNVTFIKADLADRSAMETIFADVRPNRGDQPRCASWCALWPHQSARLRELEHCWLPEHPRRMPAPQGGTPRLRVDELRLRRQHRSAPLR